MTKKDDNKNMAKKMREFVLKNKRLIIFISTIISVIIFLLSIFFDNKGGLTIGVVYPFALIVFFIEVKVGSIPRSIFPFSYSLVLLLLPIVAFLIGLFY